MVKHPAIFRTGARTAAVLLAGLLGSPQGQAQTDAAAAPASTQKPSELVQPALDSVSRAGSGVDLNKWKGSNTLRSEVDGNLASMQKDLQNTLPGLLSAADARPDSAASSLPLLLNLDALYSVLLRISMASRSGAPRDEATALEQSAVLLDSARRDLGNAILAAAKAEEGRSAELRATVQRQAAALAAASAPAAAPPAATPAPKPKRRKPAASAQKPAATAQKNTEPAH